RAGGNTTTDSHQEPPCLLTVMPFDCVGPPSCCWSPCPARRVRGGTRRTSRRRQFSPRSNQPRSASRARTASGLCFSIRCSEETRSKAPGSWAGTALPRRCGSRSPTCDRWRLGVSARTEQKPRSEEHTSELQSPYDLVCRLLLEKKKT